MLSIKNLSLAINSVPLLNNLSATLKSGEFGVLLGPNGAGKSSLVKCICGDTDATAGSIQWCDQALSDMAPKTRAQQMAVLPQKSILEFPFTAFEVVSLGRIPRSTGLDKDQIIVKKALDRLDVGHLADRRFTELSGGERQRVQLARVLTQIWPGVDEPNGLLVLDEPIDGLDFAHQRLVMDILRERANQGYTVLVVLHDLNFASEYADQVWLLCCGQMFAQGSPNSVLVPENLKTVFELDFHAIDHPVTGGKVFVN